jgi:hypothetical protein
MDTWRWKRIATHVETARLLLPAAIATAALEEGRAMTLEQAQAFALAAEATSLDDLADDGLPETISSSPPGCSVASSL